MSVAAGLRITEADYVACLRKSRQWPYLANSDLVAAKVGMIIQSTCVVCDSTSVAIRSEFSSFVDSFTSFMHAFDFSNEYSAKNAYRLYLLGSEP